MATNKRAADDDFELQRMVELDLQDYYKALAELKMERPTFSKTINSEFINHEELLNLYEKVNLSLRENTAEDTIKSYVERFRHFIHLFFADEKLEFESKYKDDINLIYLYHRTAESKKGAKYSKFGPRFAVYVFSLPSQSMEDMVLYQAISIIGNKGKITRINREINEIEVSFEDKKGNIKFDKEQSYCMDMEFNERQYISWMRSMFLAERGHVNFALFPDASKLSSFDEYVAGLSEFEELARYDTHISKFDQKQRQAIFSVVTGVHGTVPYVIWGPPGTGKTVTIVECVRQLLLKDETNRILICTPSNTAADLIARRILDENILNPTKMRRYYSLGKNVNDRDRALDKIIKIENCAIYGLLDDRFKLDPFEEMKNLRLIFSTLACSSYFEEEIKGHDFFSHIFIDEAGQSLEPETLIPISRYATEKTRIVLCGDHEQLGAVVKAHFLKQFKSCHSSLMERLMKNGDVYLDGRTFCQLTDSYRCHPKIIHFSSEHFYKGTLRAVNVENRSSFCAWKHLPKKGFPLILHAVRKGAEVKQLEGRSFHNQHEIDVVLKYIKLLKETMDVPDEEIGVISPYKYQTHKIRECLRGRKITVDSVECYQGSERRVIILTLSRSEQIGFLSEYKRLNTSLTRAKELLIVVVSLDFVRNLQPNRHYRANKNYWIPFIEYCADNGAVLLDEFAGEDGKEMDSKQMKSNVNELRKCLSEDTNAQPTHEERRKKKPMPLRDLNPVIIQKKKISPKEKYISPFVLATTGLEQLRLAEGQDEDEEQNKWQNWWNSESEEESSLEEEEEEDEEEEDEGTVSSLSTDEEGQRFWARQIPWEGRAKKRKQKAMAQQELDWNATDGGARWGEETDSTGGRGSTPGAEAEQAMVNCLMVCDAVEGLSIAGTPSSIDDDDELANAMQRLGTTDKTASDKLPWHLGTTDKTANAKLPWHTISRTSSKASTSSFGYGTAGTSTASAPSKAPSSAVSAFLELSKKRNLNRSSAAPRTNVQQHKNPKSLRIPEEIVLDNEEGVAGPSQGPKRPRKSVLTATAEIADPCVERGETFFDDNPRYLSVSRQTDNLSNIFTAPFRHGKNSNCRII